MVNKLTMPPTTKPAVMGAIVGAVACALVGFIWGGWVTGSTARQEAAAAEDQGRVTALAKICVYRFRNQDDASAKLATLAKASFWERTDLVVKSGSAALAGSVDADRDVARACAERLANSANGTT